MSIINKTSTNCHYVTSGGPDTCPLKDPHRDGTTPAYSLTPQSITLPAEPSVSSKKPSELPEAPPTIAANQTASS